MADEAKAADGPDATTMFMAQSQLRENEWDSNGYDVKGNPAHYIEVQDYFMFRLYRFMYFMRKRYSRHPRLKSRNTMLESKMELLLSFMVITPSMTDGTHPELLDFHKRRLGEDGKVPPEFNDFAELECTKARKAKAARDNIQMLATAWLKLLSDFYTRIMSGDGTVWAEIREAADGMAGQFLSDLEVDKKWAEFSPALQENTMIFMHRTLMAARTLVGQPRPDKDAFEQLIAEYQKHGGDGMSEEKRREWNAQFFKRMTDERQPYGRIMDQIWAKTGGKGGWRKMMKRIMKSAKRRAKLKQQVIEAVHHMFDMWEESCDSDDEDEDEDESEEESSDDEDEDESSDDEDEDESGGEGKNSGRGAGTSA